MVTVLFHKQLQDMEFHANQFTHMLWAERFQIKNQNISF